MKKNENNKILVWISIVGTLLILAKVCETVTNYKYGYSYWYMALWFVGALIACIFWGVLVSALAKHKGYLKSDGGGKYFALGFFLWFIGLLYVGFLPEEEEQFLRKIRECMRHDENESRVIRRRAAQ